MSDLGLLSQLPPPPHGEQGWPWTEETDPAIYDDKRTSWPKITLVTPNFNQGVFIEEAIRSILLQNYPSLEYIIFDAQSSDESVKIIEKYARWLTHWKSEPDRGQSHAINKGLALSTGKYLNWHNADDVLLPKSLFHTVRAAEQYKDLAFLHCVVWQSDSIPTAPTYSHQVIKLDKRRLFSSLKPGYQPGGLMHKETIIRVGSIDELMATSMDYDLQLRMLLEGEGYQLDTPGIVFRVHDEQKTSKLLDERRKERFRIHEKLYAMIPSNSPYAKLRRQSKIAAFKFSIDRLRETGKLHLLAIHKLCLVTLIIKEKLSKLWIVKR